ncbi:MAG: ABC transporter ATP-binding protein [Cyanobacteria bacterium]|nr:ABC transporter ATP-binding protein [Cyanobacteria bacterium CG_2015-16_32_12]NCO77872.1 ABC transporter ATP-binding protein [Cyanobacteria bacterium CG_2015-22_32_23]NCQ03065.1 ABC transporter ATP-binding protein [Cyanobacteria bacterium CG_2015-09_32_10]NCQ41970.1 ABC transporter ATP-binding protein [Cyanobacteria bacterium CG_2015-04_32_10]NCS84818.1 ABC transporter ATP-binding protein [Cyanobacteria bacterium CG_2015-02_32_10]
MATVTLDNISRSFNQVKVVCDITFQVPEGEFWVLVGPSGCGKSTILRSIAGLESITDGNLFFDDVLMNAIPARERDVAMVFQNYALYPHFTVAENLGFGLKMRGEKKQVIAEKVEFVSQILNIHHLLHRKPKQLSGGQQQRVALGRAIIRQPKVFLLDEPLSNLDTQLRDQTRTELKKLHNQVGITTIYVTHDQVEAMTLGDRIVVLDKGKIQQIGTPAEIYNNPSNKMVATFLGTPPMNIIPVTYHDGALWINEQQSLSLTVSLMKKIPPKNGQGWDLGIRPEFITVINDNEDTQNTILTQVEVIEPLGKEILVSLIIVDSEINLNLQLPIQWTGKRGDKIKIKLNLDNSYIFDPTTGLIVNN